MAITCLSANNIRAANTHSLDLEKSSAQLAYITDAAQTGLDLTGDFTFEMWVKFESIPTDTWQTFLGKGDGSAGGAYTWRFLNLSGTNRVKIRVSNNGANVSDVYWNWTPTVGTWYHLALSWNAASSETGFIFYINGKSQGAGTIESDGNVTSLFNSSEEFVIGSWTDAGSQTFDGLIDDVRVWNDVRTADEIESNFHKELVGNEANLQGYWKFNNDYTDVTANGNNLTASGSPVFSSTDYAFSEENTWSLDLERDSSQYASCADAASLSFAGDFTIEVWYKAESIGIDGNFVNKYDYTTNQRAYRMYIGSNNKLIIQYSSNGSGRDQMATTNAVVTSTGVWYHLAAAVDVSAQSVDFYVNGSFLETVTDTGGQTSVFNSAGKLAIGAGNVDSSAEEFADGLIDEVRVWNDIRTPAEISDNYQSIIDPDSANLVGYWRFENNYADLTDNNNHLTPINGPVFSTSVAFSLNTSPNNPSGLGQKRSDNGESISFGNWTNDLTPKTTFYLSDPDGSDEVKYQIQVSTKSDFSINISSYTSSLMSQGATSYMLTGLTNGSSYYWRVKCIDSSSYESDWSTAASGGIAVKIDTQPPTGQSIISFVSGNLSMTINCGNANDSGAGIHSTPYYIEISTSPNFDGGIHNSGWVEGSYTFTGLLRNKKYYAHVRARDVPGNVSEYSADQDWRTKPGAFQSRTSQGNPTRTGPNAFGFVGDANWEWDVPVKSGSDLTITAYIRYNSEYGSGTKPKLTLSGRGITPTSISATGAAEDAWELLTLNPGTPTENAILTLKAEGFSNSPNAKFYIDDINISQ